MTLPASETYKIQAAIEGITLRGWVIAALEAALPEPNSACK